MAPTDFDAAGLALGLPGGGALLAFVAAFFFGLRHATDPDHLTALLVLTAERGASGPRPAGRLGLAWGLGHALTCIALGLAVVALRPELPAWFGAAVEFAIGALIVALALRLLLRWRRGALHAHRHRHGTLEHAHPHAHEAQPGEAHGEEHAHGHAALGRSPREAFGIGLLHGAGGSAATAALLVAPRSDPAQALALLACFAVATLLAMVAVSAGLGAAFASRPLAERFERCVQGAAFGSLAFGLWYAASALAPLARVG